MVENVSLDIDRVIPCALIINELVSNSLKHAFPDSWKRAGGTGEIRIGLRPGIPDQFILTVGDNGIGLPTGMRIQDCESLGLKLVSVLAKQIKGVVRVGEGEGTEFVIEFEARR